MFHRILVTTDGSPLANLALSRAAELARLTGASVTVLYVTPVVPLGFGLGDGVAYARHPQEQLEAARAEGERALAVARTLLDRPGARFVQRDEDEGGIAATIADEARKTLADLVVMSTHGRGGLAHLLLGSVAEAVVRRVHVPVLLVRDPEQAPATDTRAATAVPTV